MPTFCTARLQQGKTKKRYAHLDFWLERLQWDWLLDFHLEKGRQKPHCTLDLWELQIKITMKMSTWVQRKERDVNGTVCSKWGKKLYMNVTFAMYTCVQVDAILPTIISNIKLLFNFLFLNFPWYLPRTFHEHSYVDLTFSYKSFLDCLSQLLDTCLLDYCDGWGGLSH